MNPFQFSSDDSSFWEADRPRAQWFPRDRNWKWPADYRSGMGWVFALTILTSFVNIALAILHPRSRTLLQNVLVGPIFDSARAAMCGITLWAIWKDKSWAKRWAVAASSIYFLEFLRQFFVSVRPAWDRNLSSLIIAVIEVVAFSWPDQQVDRAHSDQTKTAVWFTYHNRYSPAIWAGSFVIGIVVSSSLGLYKESLAMFYFVEFCIMFLLGFLGNFLVGLVLSPPPNQAKGEPFNSAGSLHLNDKSETNKKSNREEPRKSR